MGFNRRDTLSPWTADPRFQALNRVAKGYVVGATNSGDTVYVIGSSGMAKTLSIQRHVLSTGQMKPLITKLPFKGNYYSAFVAADESIIVLSIMGNKSEGKEDLYVVLRESSGKWKKPISLGKAINTTGFETSPYLTPDHKTLFFSSNGHDGFGDADVYYTTRLDNSWTSWTRPVNLGETINGASFDACFFINKKGLAFFSSNREANLSDVYEVRSDINPPKAISKTPDVPLASVAMAPPDTASDHAIKVAPDVVRDYFIVVGAFHYEDNAMKLVDALRPEGLSPSVMFEPVRKLFYVVIFTSQNVEMARARRDVFRAEENQFLKNAWLYARDIE